MNIIEGRCYRSRSGEKVGPMVYEPLRNPRHPWTASKFMTHTTWASNGRHNIYSDVEEPRDLVEEWIDFDLPKQRPIDEMTFRHYQANVARMRSRAGYTW